MIYNVFGGTLNVTQPNRLLTFPHICVDITYCKQVRRDVTQSKCMPPPLQHSHI